MKTFEAGREAGSSSLEILPQRWNEKGERVLTFVEQKKRKARHNPNCFAERVGQRKICQTFFYKVKLGSRSNWLKLFRSWLGRKKNVVRMHLSRFCFPTKVGFGSERNRTEKFRLSRFFDKKRNPGNQKQLQSQLLLFFNHFLLFFKALNTYI